VGASSASDTTATRSNDARLQLGLEAGLGINLVGMGPSKQMIPFGNRFDFGVGASLSFSQPGAEPGEYWDNAPSDALDDLDAKEQTYPCPAGYYCPSGVRGTASDFTKLGKYHGGSARWVADGTDRKDLRCAPNYYCPQNSTSSKGKPKTAYKDRLNPSVTLCRKGRECPCGAKIGVEGKWCGEAAKVPGTSSTAKDCPEGFYCTGGKRMPCPKGYVPSSCRAGTFNR